MFEDMDPIDSEVDIINMMDDELIGCHLLTNIDKEEQPAYEAALTKYATIEPEKAKLLSISPVGGYPLEHDPTAASVWVSKDLVGDLTKFWEIVREIKKA